MKSFLFLVVGIILYIFLSPYLIKDMSKRSLLEKLGYTPQGEIYRSALGEYKWFMGDILSFRSLIYYGGKTSALARGDCKKIELFNLYRTVKTSVLLNPYNEDAYYFAQGAFNWGVGQTESVNSILKYIMKYRTWDWKLPYFLGFNYSYFLHDYENAAKYFKEAGKMTGSPLFNKLAARYFYEGGDTELAISYMQFMLKSEKDKSRKKVYLVRLQVLEGMAMIEKSMERFHVQYGTFPYSIQEIVDSGILKNMPIDPYGGQYYIDNQGMVRTTSEMAKLRK